MAIPGRARITVRRATAPKEAKRAATVSKTPAPIVKWAGGKSKLLDELIARRPASYKRYFEPFLGGGALYFRLAPPSAVLCDRNVDLINMYRCVAWNVEAVIRRLETHRKNHSADYYYRMRDRWNDKTDLAADVDRAAGFIYLNKTCYNGLWRVNKSGHFNVPVGRYDSPQIFDRKALRAASRALQRADLRASNYLEAADEAKCGDFVYFDPPYHPVTATSNFTSYTADCFSEDDQRELASLVRMLDKRGCAVMVSNSDTRFIRKLYTGLKIERVKCRRAINSKATARGAIDEVIVTNR